MIIQKDTDKLNLVDEFTSLSLGPKDPEVHPENEPPPGYTPTDGDIPDVVPDMAPLPSPRRLPTPPGPKAMNMVSVAKMNGPLRGTWSIDPSIVVPALLLSPLGPGETSQSRKNLSLKSNNGAVTADVTVVSRPSVPNGRSNVILEASSRNGAVIFTWREQEAAIASGSLPVPRRLPVKLKLDTCNGEINVGVPRSFRGVIVGTTFNGRVVLSEAIQAQVRYGKEDFRSRTILLGELDQGELVNADGSAWGGDEVNAQTRNGRIIIQYEDEHERPKLTQPPSRRSSEPAGFFSRIRYSMFY